jgi:segregation and condensation protein B
MIREENINCTVEALILASPEPVSLKKLSEAMGDLPAARIRQAVADLNNLYMGCGSSFRIREVAGGYQVHILPDFERPIKNLLSKQRTLRLTRAALETLAIIAYKQPVTKVEIEHIRGVSSDGVLHNLMDRKLIVISGRAESPGRPLLYKTSNEFLKFFGLNRLSDLPRMEEIEEMIREAEPSRDQTELSPGTEAADAIEDSDTDVRDIDEADIEDDEMIAHAHVEMSQPGDDGSIPGSLESADEDGEDGGNGNGSSPAGGGLDEDSSKALELVFGEHHPPEAGISTVLYLPATDGPDESDTADSDDRDDTPTRAVQSETGNEPGDDSDRHVSDK